MINSALEFSTGEITSEFDDFAWSLTPNGSFVYPNTASVTGDLGLSGPLPFDTHGYLASTMKDEPSPERNYEDIGSEVVQQHTMSPVELENTMIEQQAVLPEAVHAHSNPETPSRPDQTFQTDTPLIPHAQSDSGLAAHGEFQDQLQLRSSVSPYGFTNNALPGLAGMANRINSMRHLNAHHPQVSSPLAQPSPLYNAQHHAPNFFNMAVAHNVSSPYDDEGVYPAYTDNMQNPNHYFNSNHYEDYGVSAVNQIARRRPQSVVPSNDIPRGRAGTDNMTLEPMPQFLPNHPGLRPNIPARGRSFTQPSAPPMYRGRVPSQASSRYPSHPQQQNPYQQQATGIGRRASFQQRSFDNYEEDADDTTSSGWQPIRQDYQLTDAATELVYQDLKAVKAERKAYTHRAIIDDHSYPKSDEEQRHYVKRMLDAMNDMSIADDNVKMQGIWAKQKKNQRDVELACWQLLELCMKATRQEEHLEPKATPKPVNTYTTFGHRVTEICKTLQQSKTICKHMLMPHYTATFVDDPEAAFSRVRNNRNVNNKKKMYLQQAKTITQQQKEEEAAQLGAQGWTEEDVPDEGYDFLADFNQDQSPAPRPKPKKAAKRRKVDDDDDAPFKGTSRTTRGGRRNNSMYQLAPLDNGRAEIVDTSGSSNRRTRRATTGGENFAQPNYAVDSPDDDDDDENDLDYFDYHTRNQNHGYSPSVEYQADFLAPQGYAQPQEVQQPRKRGRR